MGCANANNIGAKFVAGDASSLGAPPTNCNDDAIGPGGFPTTRAESVSATRNQYDTECCPWGSTDESASSALSIDACTWKTSTTDSKTGTSVVPSSFVNGEVVCTKGTVEHPHDANTGVGIFVYKRIKCNHDRSSCVEHKLGLCLDLGGNCPETFSGTPRVTQSECVARAASLINGVSTSNGLTVGSWGHVPSGCSADGTDMHWNTNTAGRNGDSSWTVICKSKSNSYYKRQPSDIFNWGAKNGGVNTKDNKDRFAAKGIEMMNTDKNNWPICEGEDWSIAAMRINTH